MAFLLLELLPINFSYLWFALLIFLFAVGMGLFFSPNQAAVMNSLPPDQRGAGAGPFAYGMHLAFTFAAIATAIAVVASALRGRRYLHSPMPAAEPVAEELAEGVAEAAALVGLDDASMLTDGNGNGASRRSRREGNGVHVTSASPGAETELGVSAEND